MTMQIRFAGDRPGSSTTQKPAKEKEKNGSSGAPAQTGKRSPSPVDRTLFDPNKTVQDQRYYDKLYPNKGSYGDWKDIFQYRK